MSAVSSWPAFGVPVMVGRPVGGELVVTMTGAVVGTMRTAMVSPSCQSTSTLVHLKLPFPELPVGNGSERSPTSRVMLSAASTPLVNASRRSRSGTEDQRERICRSALPPTLENRSALAAPMVFSVYWTTSISACQTVVLAR